MPPRLRTGGDPAEWLRHARGKRLTPFAVAGRYPGVSEDASEEDYREALETAETVFAWAENLVGKRNAQ